MDAGSGNEPQRERCPHCRVRFLSLELATHMLQCTNNPEVSAGNAGNDAASVAAVAPLIDITFGNDAVPVLLPLLAEAVGDLKSFLGSPPLNCRHCMAVVSQDRLESHEKECLENPNSPICILAASIAEKEQRREQIRVELDVLMERKSKAISIAVLGQEHSGRTNIKDQLLKNSYTFVDPSRVGDISESFIKEISLADSVLLVFDCSRGFEDGEPTGAVAAFHLGFKDLVCCFNKMDIVADSNMVYQNLRDLVLNYLHRIGFDVARIPCVPTSALTGDNISKRSSNFGWYEGPSVLEALNQVDYQSKHVNSLRFVVHGLTDDGLVSGRIYSGTLRVGQPMVFSPGIWSSIVEEVVVDSRLVREAYPGETVSMKLKDTPDGTLVKRGALGSGEHVGEADYLTTLLFMFKPNMILRAEVVACISCCHMAEVETFVSAVERAGALSLRPGDTGLVNLTPNETVAVENITAYPSLSRIILLDKLRSVIAFGVITDSEKHYPSPPAEPELPKDSSAGPSSTKKKKKKKKNKKGGR